MRATVSLCCHFCHLYPDQRKHSKMRGLFHVLISLLQGFVQERKLKKKVAKKKFVTALWISMTGRAYDFLRLREGRSLQWGGQTLALRWEWIGSVYEGSASRKSDTGRQMPSKRSSSLGWILQGDLEHNCTWTLVPTRDKGTGLAHSWTSLILAKDCPLVVLGVHWLNNHLSLPLLLLGLKIPHLEKHFSFIQTVLIGHHWRM